jgi:DNA-binding transcriptional MocR family regulator
VSAQYQVSGDSAASISQSIETGVLRGDFVWGSALPAIRALAGELDVSPATVAKAYQELRQRGVVEADGRRGTRVRSRPAVVGERSAMRLPVPEGALDLSSGEPDLRLLPPTGPILRRVAERSGPALGDASAVAMPELIDMARPRLAADGVPMEGAAITATSGTLDAIERLLTTHLRPGDAVAVEDPGWSSLFDLLAALGLHAVPVAIDQEGPDPGSLSGAIRSGARAVIITARAQNPTGAAVSASRAADLREVLATHHGVLLIEDDHAAELAGAPLNCVSPATDSWAFIRSASKPFGPDLRIAIVAGDETTIARVVGRMRLGSGWVSTVLQRLLLGMWLDEEVTALVRDAATGYARRRRALRDALQERGLAAEAATGINTWVRVPDETRTIGLLRDAGYAVAPGSIFRINTPPGVRITISPLDDEDIPRLADAVVAAVRPGSLAAPSR